MKRGAEQQLTRDNVGDDDDDIQLLTKYKEIQDPQGFQKADESTLAKRHIRALPKRASVGPKPPVLNGLPLLPDPDAGKVEAVPSPKFGGFSGFGAPTSTSNPFTFAAQPPPPVSAFASPTLDIALKPTQSTPTPPSFPSPFLALSKSIPLDSDAPPPKPQVPPPTEDTDAVALKYFKSLRGLNVSFLSTISAAVDKDPFFDVANLVESYKNLRTTIQSEFSGTSQSPANHSLVTTNSTSLFGSKSPPEKTSTFFMPKPPGPETSSKLPSTGENGTKTGGFTFPPFVPPSSSTSIAPSPFAFTPKPSDIPSSITLPESPKSAFAFATAKTSAPMPSLPSTSGFSFAASSSIEDLTSKAVSGSSSQESKPFAFGKPTSLFGHYDPASKPTSVFGSPIFGSGSTSESSKPLPFSLSPSDNKDSSEVTATPFGALTTSPTPSASIFGSSSDKPATFGSASAPIGGAFAFGKPGGSIGNPVGFGFGVSSTKPSEVFFSPPPTDKSTESTPQPDAEGNEEGGEDDSSKILPSHNHDDEGEGEEGEEITHAVRCKVFRLSKSQDKSEWKDLGIGIFRLKKHKETHVRRALMRNSNTGRILVNFRMYAALKPSLAKTSISFIGIENGAPTSYRIRVKTEEQAGDLKQALEREIAAVAAAE
ncbi:hypothetical protein JVU11DRAFT_2672 [Chiua virens]|nr:hypothetical protein JVU11DRAFT_2672 [Chiua virens]